MVAPILLYHHVNDDATGSRYTISSAVFEAHLQALQKWGYTAIPLSTMVEVLIHGGPLPERPVVITFDDGNQDIYQNAFPIMKRYGDVGTFFIVGNRVGSPGFVDANELKEMAAAGWEIGSHSWSHIDITKDHDLIYQEVAISRVRLQKTLGVAVNVFAYPFGATDPTVSQKVQDYGYRAAVGLGTSNTHTWGTLFYLSRQEVRSDYTMEAFSKLLPYASAP
ncbi:MAG TPA: polysaccharide deacetylase family protein [Anaerolineaceae bacterium]